MEKLILLSNDDGIHAPGLQFLISFVKDLGKLVVVAPKWGMSGQGHAVSILTPLRMEKLESDDNIDRYAVSGTPVDCVKFGLDQILDRKPDLIISGINHGSNTSVNILYSGTMAIALEGAMLNIPSIGFSSICYDYGYDMTHYGKWIRKIIQNTLEKGTPKNTCLNVNLPKSDKIKGIKVCHQSMGYWNESFDVRIDTHKRPYYWLQGEFNLYEKSEGSDEYALEHNYISIVPVKIDLTNYDYLDELTKQYETE